MKLQNYIADQARLNAEEVFRYAAAVPEDKLDWIPLEGARSVIDMCREIAKCPDWAYSVVTGEAEPPDEGRVKQKAEMAAWKTVEDCRTVCYEKLQRYTDMIREIPDEQLCKTKWLPFNGGREHTYLEMLDYPRWNFNYHLGQIAYVQKMYGDNEIY